MSGHTKGPWTWDEPANWHGLNARVFVAEPYSVVAQVPIEAWRPRSTGLANARLIAAAPELLEALENLLEAIPKQTSDVDWWPDELTHAVRAAKATIAKAEASQ